MTQFLLNGLCVGSVYLLVALGFGLILFAGRTFHIAHGAVFTLAAYMSFLCFQMLGMPLVLSVSVGVLAGVALGVLSEVVVYRPLGDARRSSPASPMTLLVSSLGVYIVVVSIVSLFFGAESRTLRAGSYTSVSLGDSMLTSIQIIQLLVGLSAVAGMWLFLKTMPLGQLFRAMADDPEMLSTLGYDVQKLRLCVFGLGSALASVGGILVALDTGVDPGVGFDAVLFAATAAILGGIGRFLAPAVGALALGLLQGLVVWSISSRWTSAVVFFTLVVVLFVRPQGLRGFAKRAEEL